MSPILINVEIEPTFFRKSAIKQSVTIIACTRESVMSGTDDFYWFDIVVECKGRRFTASVSFVGSQKRVSTCAVRAMWAHPTMGWDMPTKRKTRERRDAGHVLAIRKACELHLASNDTYKLGGAS